MATFLLLHGAFHGGWAWQRVARQLRAEGHETVTPTMTGLGERAHLLSPSVNLTTHVQDVVAVLEYEDLRNVIFVAHSYGAVVMTAAAQEATSRIERLVYLDGPIPSDGQTNFDLIPKAAQPYLLEALEQHGEGWWLPSPGARLFGVEDDDDAGWVDARLTRHPWASWTEPVALRSSGGTELPRIYVACHDGTAGSHFAATEARVKAEGWPTFVLNGPHDVMITDPSAVAALLMQLASSPSQSGD